MLLGNYAQVNRNTGCDLGPAFSNPFGRFKATLFPSFYTGDHVVAGETDRSAFPNGYSGVYAWWPAPKPGGIGSHNAISGSVVVVGSVAGGVNGEAALAGSGDLTGIGQLIVSLAAALSGSGGVSNADLVAYLQLAATLAGSGDLAGSASALASAAAVLEGEGGASATATATGALAAAITVVGAGLTTGNVGQAVWSALAATNNDAGTMGEKLNDAGSAANPWTEVIESGLTAAEVLRLIAAAMQGDATGLDSGSIAFKSIDGTKTRVAGSIAAGVRTITARDGS